MTVDSSPVDTPCYISKGESVHGGRCLRSRPRWNPYPRLNRGSRVHGVSTVRECPCPRDLPWTGVHGGSIKGEQVIRFDYDPTIDPQEGGTHLPVVVCDACGETIREYGNTFWLWGVEDDLTPPDVWHTHKWPCSNFDKELEARYPDCLVLSEELGMWLDELAHNFRLPR